MSYSRNKKIFLSFLCIFLILFISVTIFFLFIHENRKNDIQSVTRDISKESIKYKGVMSQSQVKKALNIINNKNLSENERYKALQNITFYFSVAYSSSHDPEIREYVLSLKEFANKNFPNQYQEVDFKINCADTACGEKPDNEIKQIRKKINEAKIEPIYLDSINETFDQASYIPVSEDVDKKYGFALVLSQLTTQNNSKASEAAQLLKDYLKKKYSFEFTRQAQ